MRGAGRGGDSCRREDPDAHLVEGPLLMRVLGKLVDEGVQLLWDDHAIEGGVSRCWVGPPSTPETFFSLPCPQAPPPQASLESLHRPRIEVAFSVHGSLFLSLG